MLLENARKSGGCETDPNQPFDARNWYVHTALLLCHLGTHLYGTTDGPWCTMTATHASKAHLDTLPQELREAFFPPSVKTERFAKGKAVKGRNEPSTTGGVAWIMHCITGIPYSEVVNAAWENTLCLFGLSELIVEAPSVDSKDEFPPLS
jgi:hypothetical protein